MVRNYITRNVKENTRVLWRIKYKLENLIISRERIFKTLSDRIILFKKVYFSVTYIAYFFELNLNIPKKIYYIIFSTII